MLLSVRKKSFQPTARVWQRQQNLTVHICKNDMDDILSSFTVPGVAIPLYGVPQQLVHAGVVQGEESLLQGRIVKLLDHFESCEGLTEAEGKAESFAKLFGQMEVGQLLLLNHQFGFCCLKRDKNVIKIFSKISINENKPEILLL